MNRIVNIIGCPGFYETHGGEYNFTEQTADDIDAILESASEIHVTIPNPHALEALFHIKLFVRHSDKFKIMLFEKDMSAFESKEILNVHRDKVFFGTVDPTISSQYITLSISTVKPMTIINEVCPVESYIFGKMYRIDKIADTPKYDSTLETIPEINNIYVWSNRTMTNQETGWFYLQKVSRDNGAKILDIAIRLKMDGIENMFIRHKSTADIIYNIYDQNVPVVPHMTSNPVLKVGESALILIPDGINIEGRQIEVKDSIQLQFYLLMRKG